LRVIFKNLYQWTMSWKCLYFSSCSFFFRNYCTFFMFYNIIMGFWLWYFFFHFNIMCMIRMPVSRVDNNGLF
jgi:hypothetical protein